jgi:NADPH:quinone reductase
MPMNTPESMTAVVIDGGKGPASALRLGTVATPVPKDSELLIKVHAAGINRPDVFQRLGLYPPPPGASPILGLEVAGEVVRAAGRWQVGDKVCALLGGGGYAQYVVCDPRHALPVPPGLSFVQAAGLPETVFTVYANTVEHGGLRAGETLMVHGATSGIGITAIQIAKGLGAKVIATSRSAAKAQAALALGADLAIDTSCQDFADIAKREGGVDVVLNMVGGDFFAKDLDALKSGGRIVYVAALAGAEVMLPIYLLMQKQAVITGSTLRARSADEKARLAAEVERVVWPLIASGRFQPQTDRVFALSDAAAAHAHLEGGSHTGKVILSLD